jgi:hypothetical protein
MYKTQDFSSKKPKIIKTSGLFRAFSPTEDNAQTFELQDS